MNENYLVGFGEIPALKGLKVRLGKISHKGTYGFRDQNDELFELDAGIYHSVFLPAG